MRGFLGKASFVTLLVSLMIGCNDNSSPSKSISSEILSQLKPTFNVDVLKLNYNGIESAPLLDKNNLDRTIGLMFNGGFLGNLPKTDSKSIAYESENFVSTTVNGKTVKSIRPANEYEVLNVNSSSLNNASGVELARSSSKDLSCNSTGAFHEDAVYYQKNDFSNESREKANYNNCATEGYTATGIVEKLRSASYSTRLGTGFTITYEKNYSELLLVNNTGQYKVSGKFKMSSDLNAGIYIDVQELTWDLTRNTQTYYKILRQVSKFQTDWPDKVEGKICFSHLGCYVVSTIEARRDNDAWTPPAFAVYKIQGGFKSNALLTFKDTNLTISLDSDGDGNYELISTKNYDTLQSKGIINPLP
ncbi:hypothetical protein [Thiolinea disciformis]|uniref:hypothetical protein n=1 Tax=Thiolinea disciformis TaxID=125614 RepID=UPI000363015E|nr:hypothetical protein [Thiolinea disciformis]